MSKTRLLETSDMMSETPGKLNDALDVASEELSVVYPPSTGKTYLAVIEYSDPFELADQLFIHCIDADPDATYWRLIEFAPTPML